MPKGVKPSHRKKKGNAPGATRELLFKEESQEYGIIQTKLGNCNLQIKCNDGELRIGHVRGAMRKKVWMHPGDLVLVSLRDFQDGKADIIHRYSPDEFRMLKSYGELSDDFLGTSADSTIDLPPEDVELEFDIDEI